MSGPEPAVHVERTSSGDVLRWVCHRPDLDGRVPPPGSDLARLLAEGTVVAVATRHGDVLVRFPRAADVHDPERVRTVHDAVRRALRETDWPRPTDPTPVRIRSGRAPR